MDQLLYNATVYTVDSSFTIANAIAIDNGRIVAVGDEKEIRETFQFDRETDLEGKFVYPGLIDPHCHLISQGMTHFEANLFGTSSYEDVVQRLRDFHGEHSNLEWIIGRGWDQNDWPNKELPNKTLLDEAFPNTPVFLTRIDGHAALVNSKALEIAGIEPNIEVEGGKIITENDELTGLLIDMGIEEIKPYLPNSEEQRKKALLLAQDDCLEVGLTSIGDAWMTAEDFNLIRKSYQEDLIHIGIYAMAEPSEENKAFFGETGVFSEGRFTVGAFKYFTDGALGSRGAALIECYHDDHDNHGILMLDSTYMMGEAQWCKEHGFQMNTHCIGDAANKMTLDVYAKHVNANEDHRWRIEHAQVLHTNDFQRFVETGTIPSVQTTHATSDMFWADERLGDDRLKNAYAYQTLLELRGMIVNGSDFPIEPVNPLFGFHAAITRQNRENEPAGGFQPDQRLSRTDALKAMTIWSAFAQFEEHEKGSIEIGKLADFTILSEDIMSIPPEETWKAEVAATVIEGEWVYKR